MIYAIVVVALILVVLGFVFLHKPVSNSLNNYTSSLNNPSSTTIMVTGNGMLLLNDLSKFWSILNLSINFNMNLPSLTSLGFTGIVYKQANNIKIIFKEQNYTNMMYLLNGSYSSCDRHSPKENFFCQNLNSTLAAEFTNDSIYTSTINLQQNDKRALNATKISYLGIRTIAGSKCDMFLLFYNSSQIRNVGLYAFLRQAGVPTGLDLSTSTLNISECIDKNYGYITFYNSTITGRVTDTQRNISFISTYTLASDLVTNVSMNVPQASYCQMINGYGYYLNLNGYCSRPILSTSGTLVFTFTQNTSQVMYNAIISFLPINSTGLPSGNPISQSPIPILNSGDSNTVSLNVFAANASSLGREITGYIWIAYNTTSSSGVHINKQIGWLRVKAA